MNYLAFGLHIKSDLDFSDMLQTSSHENDVNIEKSIIPEEDFEFTNVFRKGVQASIAFKDNAVILNWDGIVRCQISAGKELLYQQLGDDEQTLKLFLLSEAIGILLLQRNIFLLHGSAVLLNNKAHVFVGEPGAGKSTTAAAFWKNNQTILTDDLVAIDIHGDTPKVIPAFPQFKIWENTVSGLSIDDALLRPSFEGIKKYLVTQDFDSFPTEPCELKSINILTLDGNQEELNMLNVPIELLRHFPLPHQILRGLVHATHFKSAVNLSLKVKIVRLNRPEGFEALSNFVQNMTAEYETK
ncbi:serine kinase [Arcticibacterium luteifluviistationis]|uniref:Serine kinase n=1 Tax=Arcticibacterium luteifluviistationis TaxID=1784714 RepID=A0A2Z4G8A7_9BACT|nr:serine kinase [Arcticibacterium luteifluviistationis]AWV97404.1 serine kinase [Arcticibacterium luteifluviistationis]